MLSSVVVVLILLGAESVFGQSTGSRALVCVDDLRARVPGSAVMDAANLVERLYREAEVSFRWSHSVSGMKVSSSCGDAAPRLDMLIVRYRPPSVDPGTLDAPVSPPRR